MNTNLAEQMGRRADYIGKDRMGDIYVAIAHGISAATKGAAAEGRNVKVLEEPDVFTALCNKYGGPERFE